MTYTEGPGYYNGWVDWVRVTQGGRVYFLNDDVPGAVHRYHGAGFDSGPVAFGEVAEVNGISLLKIGKYTVYDGSNAVGELYIDPDPLDSISQG